jgi:hypothetical protein
VSFETREQPAEREPAEQRGPAPRGNAHLGGRFRDIAATLITFCGGLAILFLFFAAIGAVDVGDAAGLFAAALVLALIYLLGAWQRARSGAWKAERGDRERRGF